MKYIEMDIESFSSVDLSKSGVYRYAESDDFEVLLFGYSVDGGEVQVVDLAQGEKIPQSILDALTDNSVKKYAYNAAFERVCLSRYLGYPTGEYLNPDSWYCIMVWAATLGLPFSLEKVGEVLGIEKQKLTEGKELIKMFCVPCEPSLVNGMKTRLMPKYAQTKWELFKEYNKRDVEAEMQIKQKLCAFPVKDSEWDNYHLDQRINDLGIALDMDFVDSALVCDETNSAIAEEKARDVTGIDNPNSPAQLKAWLAEQGQTVESLSKSEVARLLKDATGNVEEILKLRQELAKSSVKKYTAMKNCVCSDGRARGLIQFYGANRTGRWCLSADHEILTRHGWRKISGAFNGRPEMAVYDASDGTIRFEKCRIVSFDYDGDMYLWEGKRVSQFSTPEHRNLVTDEHGARKVRYVANLSGSEKLPVCGQLSDKETAIFSDDELRLLVAYQADGFAAGGQKNGLVFGFTKERKIQRLREILTRLNYPFTEHKYSDGSTHIRVRANCYTPRIKTKQFSWTLLNENAEIFFEELGYWDGHISTNNSIQYATTNKSNAEIVATFAHLSGRAAIINTRQAVGNWSAAYYVQIWSNVSLEGISIQNAPQRVTADCQKVYCAETSTGFFLVRRNNKIWVTGNSSKILNLQNLPKTSMPTLKEAREAVKTADYAAINDKYGNVSGVLSELIRTAFVPKAGCRFIVSDFSAIEARVIAWFAGEEWRNRLFAEGGDIYCMSASQMFKVPVEKNGINGHLRQKGKIAELACGYGGSVGALKAMGATAMGIKESELKPLVTAWRQANPNITKFWWAVDRATKYVVSHRSAYECYGLAFSYEKGVLFIRLPSGRRLAYIKPRIGINNFGSECVTYEGLGTGRKWERIESYGPKFVENCLAEGTLVLTRRGLVKIEDVKADDRIWDGEEWVSHDGLIYQGEKDTVIVGTLHMTADHKILTTTGWIQCGKAQGLKWARDKAEDKITVRSCGLKERVYDIRNCGPRHRFAVSDDGKLRIVSNCVQATARDILAEAMQRLWRYGYRIVMHVHDEVVLEVPDGQSSVAEVSAIMSETPSWAQGLKLNADGYECEFYKKE